VLPVEQPSAPIQGSGLLIDQDAGKRISATLGLKPGDTVLRVNGEEIQSAEDLFRHARDAAEGSAMRLEVRRPGAQEVAAYWASP